MTWNGEERRKNTQNLIDKVFGLELEINSLTQEIKARKEIEDVLFKKVNTLIDDHHIVIYGDREQLGIRAEIDKLKDAEISRSKHIMVLYGAFITSLVGMLFNFLKKLFTGGNP